MRPWIRSLSNILPKRPLRDAFRAQKIQLSLPKRSLRDAFLAQNTILSAQKSPAGRLSDFRNINKSVSWYLFRLWYMQSEAFRYKKLFEHSPKPSKHPNHTVFNDSNVNNSHFQKKCRQILWPVLAYATKIRWIQWCSPFCLKPSKMTCVWWVSFLIFFIFLYFFIFWGSAAWGFSL